MSNPLCPPKRLIVPATFSPSDFLKLSNLVAQAGIKYFVETNAAGQAEGLETAAKLGLAAFVCDPNTRNAEVLSQRYPDADLYDGNAADFLTTVLPKLDGPAFFWLTNELESRVVEIESDGKDWHFELKEQSVGYTFLAPADKLVPLTVNGREKNDGVFPDSVEEFDRTFIGPPELAPACYRSQSEKDTWYAIVVENEYNCPTFKADDVVIDVGANIGAFCKRAHMMGSREVYGFEPSKFYMEAAKENLADLGINLHQIAIVRNDDKRKPQYFHDNGMSTMVDEGNPVDSASLDEVLSDFPKVRFLKIDCEGAEWAMLFTSKELHRVEQIAGEYHLGQYDGFDGSIGDLMGHLYSNGFTRGTFIRNSDSTGNFYAQREPA